MNLSQARLARQINEKLGDFDFLALIRLLKFKGIDEQDIWFASHNSLASQDRLIEHVKIGEWGTTVIVNLGLLSVSGAVPSYIRSIMDRPSTDDRSFAQFLAFYDHLLISSYIGQLYPEINTELINDWEAIKRRYTQLQNLSSESSVHWIFEQAFPEFRVVVQRSQVSHQYPSDQLTIGSMVLGEGDTFGSEGRVSRDGFDVTLVFQSWSAPTDFTWAAEAKRRLEQLIFPLIDKTQLPLNIQMWLGATRHPLQLHSVSQLGSDRIFTKSHQPNIVQLHSGTVNLPMSIGDSETEWEVPCRIKV